MARFTRKDMANYLVIRSYGKCGYDNKGRKVTECTVLRKECIGTSDEYKSYTSDYDYKGGEWCITDWVNTSKMSVKEYKEWVKNL